MWNDAEEPIAYLITFRTYGTWLHGDERGSVSRHHNRFATPYLRAEAEWVATNQSRMLREAVTLDARQRATVRAAIRETCQFRNWGLPAVNVRTNHAHAVVTIIETGPSAVLNALKANATRLLRERGLWCDDRSPWSDKGSTRYLWTEDSVIAASNYVAYGQGDDLPNVYDIG